MPESKEFKRTREWRRSVGRLGEDLACKYLKSKGFEVIDRNYLKKWGEIDIVTRKKGVWHFIEVKSVSRENNATLGVKGQKNVTQETYDFRAEENLHPWKLKRLERVIQSYLIEKGLDEVDWQIDAVIVELAVSFRKARVRYIENVL